MASGLASARPTHSFTAHSTSSIAACSTRRARSRFSAARKSCSSFASGVAATWSQSRRKSSDPSGSAARNTPRNVSCLACMDVMDSRRVSRSLDPRPRTESYQESRAVAMKTLAIRGIALRQTGRNSPTRCGVMSRRHVHLRRPADMINALARSTPGAPATASGLLTRARRSGVVLVALAVLACAWPARAADKTTAPGGLIEPATGIALRTRIAPTLPQRGTFTFPAPYNTLGARLTNAADCGGSDCVNPVGYSYWRNSNNHVDSDTMLIVITLDRARGGAGPTLFSYDKRKDRVEVVGPVFAEDSPLSWGTGEGWYWSATLPTKLYVNQGPALYRYDVVSHELETVFDVTGHLGPDRYIWQIHSSSDDRVHSATLRSSVTYDMLGCIVYREDTRTLRSYPKIRDFDECQVDKSGRWLVIKENVDGVNGEDNRIIDLDTGAETLFLDQEGAAGHSDIGHGYMVAQDNWHSVPGAVRVWSFGKPLPGLAPQGALVYRTTDWSLDIGHISHANARPGVPLDEQFACGGQASRSKLPRANEIVCFRLDGSLQVLVVAPMMTDLNASGGGSSDYEKFPKGNLDVTGEYFIWTSNAGSNRMDAFVVKVPSHLLVSGGGGTPPGGSAPPGGTAAVVSISAPDAGASVAATVVVSADASA